MRKLTISISEEVYQGLRRKCGPRGIGKFVDRIARPYVIDDARQAGYAEMGRDEAREREALEWAENLAEDFDPR